MNYRDRVVAVTGAASGIGRAVCSLLGREGAILGLVDRNRTALDALEKELRSAGVRCRSAEADLRNRSQTRSAFETLAAEQGPPDALIASAGVCGVSVVDDLRVAELEEIIQINFLGVVYSIEAVLPAMLARGTGQIVGIASLAAICPIPFESAYCASKAALAAYLTSLRPALRRRGVRVTSVFPGFVQTPLLDGVLAATGNAVKRAVDADTAAREIVRAMKGGWRVHGFPRVLYRIARLSRWLPPAAFDWVMTRMAAKSALPY